MAGPKFFGVMDGEPFAHETWSGSSRYFFSALRDLDCLAGATATDPDFLSGGLIKLKNIRPDIEAWRFNYHLDPLGFSLRTRKARKALAAGGSNADCVLQIGAWYDLTGSHLPVVSYHDGNLARRINSPYGHPAIGRRRLQRALNFERKLYDRIDLIFPMSQWLADSFVNDFGVDERKVFPVYAGINLPDKETFSPASYDSRHIVFVGKDFERKGGLVLLRAFEKLRRQIKDAELTIVGPVLNTDVDGVRSIGPLSKSCPQGLAQLERIFRSAAVFVMPTLYEPFGIAFAEAMSNGLPCVGSRVCAVPEIVQHGKTGFLVEPGNSDELSRVLFELIREPRTCRSMGEDGFRRYRENFRWRIVAQKLKEHTANYL